MNVIVNNMKNSKIEITNGCKVMEISSGRVGIVQNFKITPLGIFKPELCAIIYVLMESEKGKSIVSATVDKFRPVDSEDYPEYYPTVEACRISDMIAATL